MKIGSLRATLAFELLEARRMLAPLVSGDEIIESIAVGQTDSFELAASNGSIVRISVGEFGAAEPNLRVYSPGGQLVASDETSTSSSNDAVVQFTAIQPGTYSIIVSDAGNNEAMSYRIRALTLPGVPLLLAGRDSVLANGQEVESSFPLGTFNVHRFTADNGDAVHLSIGEIVGSQAAQPNLRVFSPGGQLIAYDTTSTSTSDNAAVDFEAEQPGVYTVVVADAFNDQAMNYRLRMVAGPGSPQLISGRDSVHANGEEFVTSLPLGSFNVHQLTTSNGSIVRVSVGEFGAAAPNLRVYNPGGQLVDEDLTSTSSSNDAVVEFTAFQPGTYSIIVSDYGNDQEMNYRIRALTLPGVPVLLAGRDSVLANGQEVASSFPLGTFNVHRFTVENGDAVNISVGEIVGSQAAQPNLLVFSPGGQLVASDTTSTSSSNSAQVAFEAQQPGVYTVVVADAWNDQSMDYRLTATGIRATVVASADFDEDGDTDGADFLTWQRGVGTPNATRSQGNADGDLDVDGADLLTWEQEFAEASSAAAIADAEAFDNALAQVLSPLELHAFVEPGSRLDRPAPARRGLVEQWLPANSLTVLKATTLRKAEDEAMDALGREDSWSWLIGETLREGSEETTINDGTLTGFARVVGR